MTQRRTAWFAAAEATYVGRPHLHVLLGGTAALSTKQIERAWSAGYSRMTVLRSPRDAVRYVVKRLGRYPDDYDLSRRWIPGTVRLRAEAEYQRIVEVTDASL
jgi:hypothetical protein